MVKGFPDMKDWELDRLLVATEGSIAAYREQLELLYAGQSLESDIADCESNLIRLIILQGRIRAEFAYRKGGSYGL